MAQKGDIERDLKAAMKSGDGSKVSTLRMLLAAFQNEEITLKKKDIGLSEQEVEKVIRREIRKRTDAAEEFRKANREDLAEKESSESEMLKSYVPPELSEEEISKIVREAIHESGLSGKESFPQVMKLVMQKLKGRASGDRVSSLVKNALG